MTCRVALRYERRRGFYRVEKVFDVELDLTPAFTDEEGGVRLIYVLSAERPVIGSYRSPKKLLEGYLGKM